MITAIVSLLAFCLIFGAGFLATRLRARLPEHHLSPDTRETVKLTMGLVATMTALVLGLLVASAKGTYDAEKSAVTTMGAKLVVLDRVLAHYGPEAQPVRDQLRTVVTTMVDRIWPQAGSKHVQLDPNAMSGDAVYDAIEGLNPQTDSQKALKTRAENYTADLALIRWLAFEQASGSISPPLLIVVVCWLAILFFSFGVFAPPNWTALIAILVSSLSVSGAIFLILELDQPFTGLIHVSGHPMMIALQHLGR